MFRRNTISNPLISTLLALCFLLSIPSVTLVIPKCRRVLSQQSHRPKGPVLRIVLRWVGPTVRLRTSADFAGLSLLSQKSLGDSPSQKCLLAQRSCTTGQSCAAARYTVPVTINEHAARVWQHELKRPALWTGLTKHLQLRLIASKQTRAE